MSLDYNELKEYMHTKDTLTYPYIQLKKDFEKHIAKILRTQRKRIRLDTHHDTIIIDVTINRDVAINIKKICKLKKIFQADDVVISSPQRCKIHIHMIRECEP